MLSAASFHIRKATAADASRLRSLIELSVRTLQRGDYTPAQIAGALGHTLGLDTQLIADETYFVAEAPPGPSRAAAPTLVACGGWSFRRTLFGSDHGSAREAALLDPASEPARIRAIFVQPGYERRGLGSLLLSHCEQQARLAGFTRFAMGSTITGVPLYQLRGYRALETVQVPLPNGEVLPVVHMVKP